MFRLKKIDKLLIQAFVGPFILTTAVVTFILLIQQLADPERLEQLTGKGLGYDVFSELILLMAMVLVPVALPLAVLLGSLITFGNLGEHFELTAIKSAGISLVRALRPIMLFAVLLSIFSFIYSDQILPHSNLQFYRLLWDIKQKSPALSIKEGIFYNGLPNYTIKIGYKYPDGKGLKDVMIYNHTTNMGNRELIMADSGRMYTINEDRYLVLELFRGKSYHDQVGNAAMSTNAGGSQEKFVTNTFQKSQMIFNLSSFVMNTTDNSAFQGHKYMHNLRQLLVDLDSLKKKQSYETKSTQNLMRGSYAYEFRYTKDIQKKKDDIPANIKKNIEPEKINKIINKDTQSNTIKNQNNNAYQPQNNVFPIEKNLIPTQEVRDFSKPSITPNEAQIAYRAVTQARNIQATLKNRVDTENTIKKEYRECLIEYYKKFTYACACFTMFLIGAPLGSIIKKGGLGVPVLVSVVFFIIYYLMTIAGEKWVKEGAVHHLIGMWYPNVSLFLIGLFFLRQARNDSRVFESDMYWVALDRLKKRFSLGKKLKN
ncbi:MAG: YjgP/YjgQ family permease [Cytophagales bacterium]|nr:MAG: YjgP/YjgQ family permease [Cytophagales bacterium]